MIVHPKTAGAALGGSLGTVIVSILASIHGVHLTPEANAAIPTFLAALGAYLSAPYPALTAAGVSAPPSTGAASAAPAAVPARPGTPGAP